MPSIGSPQVTGNFPIVRRYAYMKPTWAGAWQLQPFMVPQSYTYSCAPMVSRATVQYEFGYINQPSLLQSLPFSLYVPYNAGPWYVALATQVSGQAEVMHWVGQMAEDEIILDRPTNPSGVQTFTAFGFEHLLDRKHVSQSYVIQDGTEGVIDHVLVFNQRYERGGELFGNRSTNPDSNDVYRFFDPNGGGAPQEWTALNILVYILYYFANKLPDGTASPIQFLIAGQYDALDDIVETFDFSPRERCVTVWEALNQLIDRRRGLGFVLRQSGVAGSPVYIWIYSQLESPITLGDATLPANTEQFFFDVPNVWPYNQLMDEIPMRYSSTNMYDTIIVQGERIRVAGSFRFRDGTLEEGWTDALEMNYEGQGQAPVDEPDLRRSNDIFRSVYSYFTVPVTWDWYVYDADGTTRNLLLTAKPDGTVTTTRNADLIGYNYGKVFERDLPFKEATDYSVSPKVDHNPAGIDPELAKLIVFLPNTDDAVVTKYYLAEKGADTEDEWPSASVRPLDTSLGVEVKASPNYLLAHNHFDPSPGHEEESDADPIDYESMVVTASIYSDVRTHVVLNGVSLPQQDTKPALIVNLADCHYWYVAPNTMYDVKDDGTVKPFLEAHSVVRNDTFRLRQVGAYLRWWFSRQRQALTLTVKYIGIYAQPGQLITSLNTVWNREPVNAVITSREVNFEDGWTRITTSYMELDNMISLLDDPQRRTRGVRGRRRGR